MMASKVILLKYLARFCDAAEVGQYLQLGLHCDKSALILKRTKTQSISIQGYPEIPFSEKSKGWFIFQQAVKDLLGVTKDTSICVRFSDAPQRIVGSLAILLTEPRYLIDLVVHPVNSPASNPPVTTTNLFDETDTGIFHIGKSPRNAFKVRHGSSFNLILLERQRRAELAREVSNQEDMNRLYCQLADLSISLHRTQMECEAIAKRCDSQEPMVRRRASSFKKENRDGKKQKKVHYSVSFSSSVSSESGKGSMVDSEMMEGDNVDALTNSSHPSPLIQENREEVFPVMEEGEDEKIERLLKVAESLASRFQTRASDSSVMPLPKLPSSNQQQQQERSPDVPTCVCVRPSFKHGGAYVMWDPVSLDGEDCNGGHKILGYGVYVDDTHHCFVGGALSSQVELEGMVNGDHYQVQVCTISEGMKSLLTPVITYKHLETNRLSHDSGASGNSSVNSSPVRTPPTEEAASAPPPKSIPPSSVPGASVTATQLLSHPSSLAENKVAKVHSWLKDSLTEFPVAGDEALCDIQPPISTRDTNSLHVHFEDEVNICTCGGDEDTKSISSSHTSGIVTDFLASPKLSPSCTCRHCYPEKPSTKVKSGKVDSGRNDGLIHALSITSPSKLKVDCDFSPSKNAERRSSCENGDSVIDQPLFLGKDAGVPHLQSFSCSPGVTDRLHADYTIPGRSRPCGIEAKGSLLATYV